ncbi:endonuclease/exonuclease/phosphatase family protein [Massilia sp. GCM10020059]|uniref:Endonuclease/exonuclease/phosphatase family protein n=1 Tax=Massilia agrisoli TaxID=2892444 RepID=A0ABS8ISR5_9BURK|nr:endonuclease/exonuclease/phosphatase family protein [Massilia agrisoli]MCC6071675.1 endonuclease/exonuclease/phosphatase family protein [Massilia agrisoli]
MKLITWNIQRGRGPGQACSLDRVVSDLRCIADADVLCFQEVSSGFSDLAGCDGRNQFAGLAQRLPGYTPVAGLATDVLDEDGGGRRLFGNMIFSRYPVRQVFRHALPWPAHPGVMSMQRIALEATLDTPLGPLRLATTHLEYFSPAQRTAQVERLRDLHLEASLQARAMPGGSAGDGPFSPVPRPAPVLLAGDFNFVPGSSDHGLMLAPFGDSVAPFCDAWEVANAGVAHAPTVCVRDPQPFTFDFVFASADLADRVRAMAVCDAIDGPDHQPVLVELA